MLAASPKQKIDLVQRKAFIQAFEDAGFHKQLNFRVTLLDPCSHPGLDIPDGDFMFLFRWMEQHGGLILYYPPSEHP